MIEGPDIQEDGYPKCAGICDRCGERGVVSMDGYATCLSCGDSEEITPPHEMPDREGY